jgi:putative membrane protein
VCRVGLIENSLSTLPGFLAYFGGGCALTVIFVVLYARLTPYSELRLIREGNVAAALALTGGLLGFMIPLASVIAHAAELVDLTIWGSIALIVQIAGFLVCRLVFPGLPRAIANGQVAEAIFLAGLSLALGILDAACMVG